MREREIAGSENYKYLKRSPSQARKDTDLRSHEDHRKTPKSETLGESERENGIMGILVLYRDWKGNKDFVLYCMPVVNKDFILYWASGRGGYLPTLW
jgi:hypothetical protein